MFPPLTFIKSLYYPVFTSVTSFFKKYNVTDITAISISLSDSVFPLPSPRKHLLTPAADSGRGRLGLGCCSQTINVPPSSRAKTKLKSFPLEWCTLSRMFQTALNLLKKKSDALTLPFQQILKKVIGTKRLMVKWWGKLPYRLLRPCSQPGASALLLPTMYRKPKWSFQRGKIMQPGWLCQ